MKFATLICSSLIAATLTVAGAGAATKNQMFQNDYDSNALYFWSDNPSNLQIALASFGAHMGDWTVDSSTGDALVLSGSTLGAGQGRFTLSFDYVARPFTLQWAEVFFDSGVNHLLDGGTLSYGSSGWSGTSAFTRAGDIPNQFAAQASVPLPPSLVLLLSSLLFIPLRRLSRVRA